MPRKDSPRKDSQGQNSENHARAGGGSEGHDTPATKSGGGRQAIKRSEADATIANDRIARVRRFNRFYTRQLGVLRKTYLGSPYSLAEARVLYEIFKGGAPTATDIGRALDLDAGYLSRTLRSFEKRGLIVRKASANDARQSHLALTARGRKAFVPLDRRSQDATAEMLGRL